MPYTYIYVSRASPGVDKRLPLVAVGAFCVALVLLVAVEEGFPGHTLTNPFLPRSHSSGTPPGLAWSLLPSAGSAPPTASGMIAYYPPMQELVLLTSPGGCAGSETWIFSDGSWLNLTPDIGPGPSPARTDGGLVYDSAIGALVLFGGSSSCGVYNDTWTFANDAWTPIATPEAPPPLYGFAMAYDASDGYVLLTGGCCVDGADSHETWAFQNDAWSNLTNGTGPSVDLNGAMTYDPAAGEVVYVDGYASGYVAQSTWTFHAGVWQRVYPSHAPSNRAGMGLVYDTALGKVVLLGGYTKVTTGVWQNLTDTWSFGGTDWSNLTASVTDSPPFVSGPTLMTYDGSLNEVVLFLGSSGTWVLGP